jgi:hypothetical protein
LENWVLSTQYADCRPEALLTNTIRTGKQDIRRLAERRANKDFLRVEQVHHDRQNAANGFPTPLIISFASKSPCSAADTAIHRQRLPCSELIDCQPHLRQFQHAFDAGDGFQTAMVTAVAALTVRIDLVWPISTRLLLPACRDDRR